VLDLLQAVLCGSLALCKAPRGARADFQQRSRRTSGRCRCKKIVVETDDDTSIAKLSQATGLKTLRVKEHEPWGGNAEDTMGGQGGGQEEEEEEEGSSTGSADGWKSAVPRGRAPTAAGNGAFGASCAGGGWR